jgi:hypothetical protein
VCGIHRPHRFLVDVDELTPIPLLLIAQTGDSAFSSMLVDTPLIDFAILGPLLFQRQGEVYRDRLAACPALAQAGKQVVSRNKRMQP